MIRLCLDLGYGDLKAAIADNGSITNLFKETISYVDVTPPKEKISIIEYDEKDTDIVKHKDKIYRIGESALFESDKNVINVIDYDSMKMVAPLVVKKYLRKYKQLDQILVSLSLAFIDKKEDFKNYIVDELLIGDKLKLSFQGATAKFALDNIGLDLDNPIKIPYSNYLLFDIGFNTIDIIKVVNGRMLPDVYGHEGEGVVKLAKGMIERVKKEEGFDISLPASREVLKDGGYKIRGKLFDIQKYIDEESRNYINGLYNFIEEHYGKQLDLFPNIILVGGGAELIRKHLGFFNSLYDKDFAIIPKRGAEYYNAVGALFV